MRDTGFGDGKPRPSEMADGGCGEHLKRHIRHPQSAIRHLLSIAVISRSHCGGSIGELSCFREGMMKSSIPSQPRIGSITPMVYVKDKTVWQYKLLVRSLSSEQAPTEEELNGVGKEGWELTGIVTNHPLVYFYFKKLKD